MEKKYTCRCGKEFQSLQSLGGHSRWCTDRNAGVERSERKEEDETRTEEMREQEGASTTNLAVDGSRCSPANEETNEDEVVPPSSLQYRCVQCYDLFPSVEAFRDHYLVEHLRVNGGVVEEQSASSDVAEEAKKKERTSEPRSFCKRCRGRILSSSEDEDGMSETSSKRMNKETAGTGPTPAPHDTPVPSDAALSCANMSRTHSDMSISSSKSAESTMKEPAPGNHVGPAETSASDSEKKGYDGDSGLQHLPSPNPGLSKAEYDKIMNNLLKDANALSKVYKVLILNFMSGRRVNPDPTKGPIQVIRLGENVEMVRAEDGSEAAVMQESYVKLNFDTGEWEKLVKTKRIDPVSSSSSASAV